MTDDRWNNGGEPEAKKGMPTWAKVLLGCLGGCGVLMLLLLGSCFGVIHYVKNQKPEEIERKVKGWVREFAAADWARFREAAESLRSESGARTLYASHPDLRECYPTEQEFLKAAEAWRPLLEEVPQEMPPLDGNLHYNRNGSRRSIGYRNSLGTKVRMVFEGTQLQEIQIRAGDPAPEKQSHDEEAS